MRVRIVSVRGVWALACGLAVLTAAGPARAQQDAQTQDYNFQNVLRDVTGGSSPAPETPPESYAAPASEPPLSGSRESGSLGSGGPQGTAVPPSASSDAAASWESEDPSVEAGAPAPAFVPSSAPLSSPITEVAPPSTRVPDGDEQAQPASAPTTAPAPGSGPSQAPTPEASGIWSPETGAPIAGIIPLPEPPPAFVDRSSVKLQTLDKATARTMTFEARVGSTVQFGPLFIKVRACRSPPPEERMESAAFLQIWENAPKSGEPKWIFSGWMFGSSPALSSMDHPIYDVWVISCLEDVAEAQTPPAPGED